MQKHGIVIVTYNRLDLLRECVKAVREQTLKYDHIVIVDNASNDGTAAYLDEIKKDKHIHIYREKENRGGAGGFARGLAIAQRLMVDWITLIDDDAILEQNYLEEINKAITKTNSRYEAYAGVPLTNGLRPGHRRRVKGVFLKRELAVPIEEYKKPSFECDIASFCGLVISRKCVSEIGLPDARFFLWYDDTEYCLRISERGPILNWNQAIIQHYAKVSDKKDIKPSWKDYYGIRNLLVMAAEHYGRLTMLFLAAKKTIKGIVTSGYMLIHGETMQTSAEAWKLYRRAISDGLMKRVGKSKYYHP